MNNKKVLIKYYTVKEAATYLGITVPALRSKIFRRQISYKKLNERVLFSIRHLEESLVEYKRDIKWNKNHGKAL